jgi:hypothetical protein
MTVECVQILSGPLRPTTHKRNQQAWDVRNSCKHNGAVLPLSAAPVGRGADGVDAMA